MSSYVEGDITLYTGQNLVTETNGGVVVVEIQYRLGLFGIFLLLVRLKFLNAVKTGFLAGSEVKDKGALNAGLRKCQHVLISSASQMHVFS